MVVLIINQIHHPTHLSLSSSSSLSPLTKRRKIISRRIRTSFSSSSSSSSSSISSSSSSPMEEKGKGFMEFPHLSISHRNLMVDLVSTMETTLSSQLLPSSLPPDVQFFQNETGTSQGALHIRSGHHSSLVDCILGSWIHCELPTGGPLDITTLTVYLNSKTDAPRFLIEFLQSSPTSLILLLDLPPRKDLVFHTDYLHTFYEQTKLDEQRKKMAQISEVQPYVSSSLYIRCGFSPTAVLVKIDCVAGDHKRMEEIIRDHVGPVAKDMLGIWLNVCASGEGRRELDEEEKVELEKRDALIKKKNVEIDLALSLPRLFGPDLGSRVVEAIKKFSNT